MQFFSSGRGHSKKRDVLAGSLYSAALKFGALLGCLPTELKYQGGLWMKTIMWTLAVGAVLLATVAGSHAQTDSVPAVAAPETPAPTEQSATTDNIRRAVFATDVVDREPIDELKTLTSDANKICFFTEIVDFEGGSITHRWIYNGETAAEVTFDIGGPRWRVYSSKNLTPEWVGTWAVEIVDGKGNTVNRAEFVYSKEEQLTPEAEDESKSGFEG
jgi:hypothetical protein